MGELVFYNTGLEGGCPCYWGCLGEASDVNMSCGIFSVDIIVSKSVYTAIHNVLSSD